MYLKLLDEARALMEKAVERAGFKSDDMYMGESQHADASSSLPFRLGKGIKEEPGGDRKADRRRNGHERVHR